MIPLKKIIINSLIFILFFCLLSCNQIFNNPHKKIKTNKIIYYSSFSQSPKTLDPAQAYSSDEISIISQIYEPILQYDYLKRPYMLTPLIAQAMPQPIFLNKNKEVVSNQNDNQTIAYSVYDIAIKPGVYFQFHPAFAKDSHGHFYYHNLSQRFINSIRSINDFKHSGTRELIAEDYVYQIKRLADPKVQSPIFGLMSKYILGFNEFSAQLNKIYQSLPPGKSKFLNLNHYDLLGAKVLDRYHYRIILKGKYPQFLYWLSMTFFAAMPWEVDYFYSQPGMASNNLTLAWFPIGTGPYTLTANNPNSKMALMKNPNFHGETYPTKGSPEDIKKGLLNYAGLPLPFIDEIDFSLEKESIPRWTKFMQGYYDQSAISSDNFDQAIHVDINGHPFLTPNMKAKNFRLQTAVEPGIYYLGFNMLDDTLGGHSEKARKLRQAISIALNYEEYISIFLNGRGFIAQGPLPPGIFGYEKGIRGYNPYIFNWENNKAVLKPIDYAKKLLAEAGYPNGRNSITGQPLILNFDVATSGGTEDKAQFEWERKQFAKLGIELQIRATEYNRFQEKMRTGNFQIYTWGWNADYPDPENFFFLLYGPNGKVKYGGENASNYMNTEFNKLYDQMKNMPNNAKRAELIKRMIHIVQKDAPWVWGFYPEGFVLSQQWVGPYKISGVANNFLKYISLNSNLRAIKQEKWNKPILWPLGIIFLILIMMLIPVIIQYWKKRHNPVKVV